jgi:hypothetical protein
LLRTPRLRRPAAELLIDQQRGPQLAGQPMRMVC